MFSNFFSTILDVLKKLTSLNKTVYLLVYREYRYADWQKILDSDGNATDAKIITDFAVNNNIKGVIMFAISPVAVSIHIGSDSML